MAGAVVALLREWRPAAAFTEEDEFLLETIAAEVSAHLAPRAAYAGEVQRVERRLREISAICALSDRFARAGTLGHVLQRVAEGAAELLECVSASVLLRRDEATLEVVAVSGTIADSVAGFVLPMDSLGGVVTRTGEPRTWMEGEEDPLAGRAEAFENAGIRDCMFVPLNGSHETFGALAVCNRRAAGRRSPGRGPCSAS